MKKILMILFLGFLVLGVSLISPTVLADENDTDDSGSDSEEEVNVDEKMEDERSRIRERIRDRDGVIEREFEGRFFDAEGNEVRIKRRIIFKDGEFEIRTKLRVEGNGSNLSVLDSEGKKHRIRVTPERLKALMLKRFNADNVSNFSLEEIEHKNIPRVVYKINSEHPGRFLGIFKLALKAETQVDPETGEILAVNRPWWAFLVTGTELPPLDEVVGNETLAEEVVADDEELEEELEVEEIEEEVDDEETNSTS